MTPERPHARPILVTGAAGSVGSIGRNLTEMLLAKGHKVRALQLSAKNQPPPSLYPASLPTGHIVRILTQPSPVFLGSPREDIQRARNFRPSPTDPH